MSMPFIAAQESMPLIAAQESMPLIAAQEPSLVHEDLGGVTKVLRLASDRPRTELKNLS
jgi:hypothetical protein